MPALLRIVYDEDGYPREMTGEAEWRRAIRSGSLTPDTEVEVYEQGEAPRVCRAGAIAELAQAFGLAAPAPPPPPALPVPEPPSPAPPPPAPPPPAPPPPPPPAPAAAPATVAAETVVREPPVEAAYQPRPAPPASKSGPWIGAGIGLFLLILAIAMTARGPQRPAAPVDVNMDLGNDLAAVPLPDVEAEPLEAAPETYRTSFDCARATGIVETTICSDPGLAAQDRALADLYRERLRDASLLDASALRDSQAAWRDSRGQCVGGGEERDCLARLYAGRIAELREFAASAPPDGSARADDGPADTLPPSYDGERGAGMARPAQLRSGSISGDDYPAAALEAGAEGTTVVRYLIDADGRVADCDIESSSGHAALDGRTCALIRRRFRFNPALADDGKPIEEMRTQRIVWRLP